MGMAEVERELRDEAAAVGIPIPPDKAIPEDGRFLRYGRPDRRASDDACFARLGIGYSGRPYGIAGCKAIPGLLVRAPLRRDRERCTTPAVRRQAEAHALDRQRAKANERARQELGTERARRVREAARPCTKHAYWTDKLGPDVPLAPGLLVDGTGDMIVPRYDAAGRFVGYQRIKPDGTKRYGRDTPTRGTYFGIGRLDRDGTLCIAEGLATAATVHHETGHPVAVAFDANNLLHVAMALRGKYSRVNLVLAADDDRLTEGNPGRTKATEAARAVGGRVLFPTFCCSACRCSDFNDVASCARRRGQS